MRLSVLHMESREMGVEEGARLSILDRKPPICFTIVFTTLYFVLSRFSVCSSRLARFTHVIDLLVYILHHDIAPCEEHDGCVTS